MTNMLRGLDLQLKGLGLTEDECCARVGGGGRAGSIVCCEGKVVPCAWHAEERDAETLRLKIRATMIHEGVHANDANLDIVQFPYAACKPKEVGYKGVPNLEASECRAYATELPWLEKGYDECTTDYCRREFDRQIRFTTAAQNNDPEQGNWMNRYCNKAHMQVPAEARRITQRFASQARPPAPAPPREIKTSGAPTLEFPLNDQYVPKPKAPAPTLEFPLGDQYVPPAMPAVPGGRPDASGICPDGWSYVKLDGQPACRNSSTGEFKTTSGGLIGLGYLGATKKKTVKKQIKRSGGAARSHMSGGQIAVSIGVPASIAAAAYAGTRSPIVSAVAGVASYFLVRAVQKHLVRQGTIGPKISGTNQNIVNY